MGAVVVGAVIGYAVASLGPRAESQKDGNTEIHFAPDENLERIDVGLIDGARVSIDIAAYVLTDGALIEALRRAGARGVKVRIWRDPEMAEKVGMADVAARIAPDEPGVEMREKAPGALMRLKGYCVDGAVLRTGSANFSHSGLTEQDNDLLVLHSRDGCVRFEAKFTKAWREK
jgi:phosphatidylserine/phosphatidylglycerophosphate/cardiolipin synthase-like enzyme